MVGNFMAYLLTFAPVPTWYGMGGSQPVPSSLFRMEKKVELICNVLACMGLCKGLVVSVLPAMEP